MVTIITYDSEITLEDGKPEYLHYRLFQDDLTLYVTVSSEDHLCQAVESETSDLAFTNHIKAAEYVELLAQETLCPCHLRDVLKDLSMERAV